MRPRSHVLRKAGSMRQRGGHPAARGGRSLKLKKDYENGEKVFAAFYQLPAYRAKKAAPQQIG